jgi:lipoate-protein ligase A
MEWRFISAEAYDPALNMAIDEAIMQTVASGDSPPTIRFYRWAPATMSIGYFQKAEQELDLDAIREAGIGFVRRPTGGRAVLHDRELTYSIIVPETYAGLPTGVTESYRMLSMGLLHGFKRLGLNAEMADLSRTEQPNLAGSAACFDSPSWYEIVVEGQKLAGSAQLRQKGAVLQHGSVLLDLDVDQFYRLLRFNDEAVRERMKAAFAKKAVAINDVLHTLGKSKMDLDELEKQFEQGFAEGLHIRLNHGALSEAEWALARQLVGTKYGQPSYLFKK